MADAERSYTERLGVPLGWWVLGLLLVASFAVAYLFYLGPLSSVVVAAVGIAIMTGLFLRAATPVRVDGGMLTVGRNRVEARYLAGAKALDAAATWRRRGPEADGRAFLLLRPYLASAVEVTLADPADPHPYWLISTRRPAALAAAVNAAVAEAGPPPARPPVG